MQLISPFLHAHAFGIGAINHAPGIHIHLEEIDSVANPDFDKATIHNETIPEHSIGMTSGVSEKLELQLLIPVLLSLISLSLYLADVRRFYSSTAALLNKLIHSRLPNPRAPPSHH